MAAKPINTVLTIVMNLLIIVAVVVVARLVVLFFGELATSDIGKAVATLSAPLVLPLGLDPVKTPYGGIFELNALVSVFVMMVAEWVLGMVRHQA